MRAYVLFTERAPLLILTSLGSVTDPQLVARLARLGVTRFIAHEVAVEEVRRRYGRASQVAELELGEGSGVSVLDHNGRQVLRRLPLSALGVPVATEPRLSSAAPPRAARQPVRKRLS